MGSGSVRSATIHRTLAAVAVLLVLAAAPWGSAEADLADGRTVEVVLDGERTHVPVLAMDGGTGPVSPDDLLDVGGWLLPRGAEPTLEFRRSPCRLWQRAGDGKERVIGAVAIGSPPQSTEQGPTLNDIGERLGTSRAFDTFQTIPAEELSSLRCVWLIRPHAGILSRLGRLDLARTMLVVTATGGEPLPPLPHDTRLLDLSGGTFSGEGPSQVEGLARLRKLRFLRMGWRNDPPFDASVLTNLRDLEILDLSDCKVTGEAVLARLRSLRALDVSSTEGMNLEPCASLDRLRRIALTRTALRDLTPLAGLPALEQVDASGVGVTELPVEGFPALRSLRLDTYALPPGRMEAFRAAHGASELVTSPREALLRAVRGLDRVRVRSGGACHRAPTFEVTLADVTTPEGVESFLAALDFHPPGGRALSCGCCGSPTFELYRGSTLLASLGWHGEERLRWPDGPWRGDASQTPHSRAALVAWTEAHSTRGPLTEAGREAYRTRLRARRDERRRALLHPAAGGDVEPLSHLEEVGRALETAAGPAGRLALALRLRGLRDSYETPDSWSLVDGVVAQATTVELVDAALAAEGDADLFLAIGLTLAGQPERLPSIPSATQDRILPPMVRAMLESAEEDPVAHRRVGTLLRLAPRPPAVAAARAYVVDRSLPRFAVQSPRGSMEDVDALTRLLPLDDMEGLSALLRAVHAALPGASRTWQARNVARELARATLLLPRLRAELHAVREDADRPEQSMAQVIASHLPAPTDRVDLAFRLLGDLRSRYAGDDLDRALLEALSAEDPALVDARAEAAIGGSDARAMRGVGWWILESKRGSSADDPIVRTLHRTLSALWTDPDEEGRIEAVRALGELPRAAYRTPLLDLLGVPAVDAPPPLAAASAPSAAVVVEAALVLLARDERAALPRAKELAAKMPAEAGAPLRDAIDLFEGEHGPIPAAAASGR